MLLAELEAAYLRRLHFEAQVMASAFLGPVAGSVGSSGVVVGATGKRYQQISPQAMLAQIAGR